MNSIESARNASAFDVLIYASEEKELAEAQYLDFELQKTKSS
ncbi:hypothetical protein SAMN05444266_101624 [Chitinophaga jiangningensis]|uniref:Uncharacterized protein n=2 Tax=Chitinophaga jiangningensis TaxID=1419482 RepID=A0A1M6WHP7_9BACT|nr:hypothetical protein SAMN05444266_101624 [Chitinophaga jiangningensis]